MQGKFSPYSFLPQLAVLELTYKCNHACRFCCCPWYAGMIPQEEEMNVEEWKRCMNELAEAGVTYFTFTGGEAILKEGWEEIVRYAAGLRVRHASIEDGELKVAYKTPEMNLLSNGKAMSEKVLDLCLECGITLSMSLPGVTAYKGLTCGGTEPEHILTWFERAREKNVKVAAGITVTSENYHEIFETVSIAILAGASSILINRFLPGGRGLKHRELDLSAEQVRELPFIVEKALAHWGRTGHMGTEYPYCLAIGTDKLSHMQVSTRCGAASSFFVVGANGKIRVCNHSPRELCYWEDWRKLKQNDYWNMFVTRRLLPEECKGCAFSLKCDGGCPEAAHVCYGSPLAPDPVFKNTKIQILD